MKVGIATDHGGFGLKEELVAQLRAAGDELVDFGAHKLASDDDYPDFCRCQRSAAQKVGSETSPEDLRGYGVRASRRSPTRNDSGITAKSAL